PAVSSGSSVSGTQEILRVPVSAEEVQQALKGAGYYDGAIDGKLGSGSQRAIKAFQKDHGLESDGIVGQKTWAELKNYVK
ncbi:MAG TPA: peptidoglycan-binding domain-containing protein, partial [Candidatus Omnitrophota bacterium]|nr:peptidoglycan-binding domain-containing protein [Candidatus Omnitrophota bacterium]